MFFWLSLGILFFLALAIRFQNISAPGYVLEREYRSAIIARSYYFDATESIPEWRRHVAGTSKIRAGVLEPTITEYIVSFLYRIAHGDHLWIARLTTSVFWIIGGIFLYKLSEKLMSKLEAVFATAYYLLVPVGVLTSRSFQPDSLMIMFLIISLYAIVIYFHYPSMVKLLLAASLTSSALFVRPLVLFIIFSAFLSLSIYKRKSLRWMIDKQSMIFFCVALTPTALFYGYGILISKDLEWKVTTSFIPSLLLKFSYWNSWLQTATEAIGIAPMVAALIGLSLLQDKFTKVFIVGLGTGYFIFCLIFNYHIRFATYYHVQLIPIIAIPFGFTIGVLFNKLNEIKNNWQWWIPIIIATILIIYHDIYEVRSNIGTQNVENAATAQEIGKIVNHSTNSVYIASYYGMPLEYYSEISGWYWPRRISDRDRALGINRSTNVQERLDTLGFSPEYFIVTDFREFNTYHDDLKEYLTKRCSLLASSDSYVIYNDCSY